MTDIKTIKLHIRATQSDGMGANDTTEFYTEGSCYEKDGYSCLRYEESEVSGMEGTMTTLEIGEQEAILRRTGAISSSMLFRRGCETQTLYATAFGDIDLSILTEKLDIKVCNGRIDGVYLKYRLRFGLDEAYTNEMSIRVSYQEV